MRERLRAQQNDVTGMVQEDGEGQMLKHDHHLLQCEKSLLESKEKQFKALQV